MVERDLDQRLRGFFAIEVGGENASPSLVERVIAIPDERPATPFVGDRRTIVLLAAAALLLALVVGTALAVGSGLVKLPSDTAPDDTTHVATTNVFGCTERVGGAAVARVRSDGAVAGQIDPSPANLRVYADGSMFIRPAGGPSGLEGMIEQRELTSDGLGLLLGALHDPRLDSCRSYDGAGSGSLEIALDSSVGGYSISVGGMDTHVTTQAEADAIDKLRRRLQDVDLGLPGSVWATAGWEPYHPGRWQVEIDFTEGPGTTLDSSIALPDGTPLVKLGADDPTAAARGISSARCAVVDSQVAASVVKLLEEADADTQLPNTWGFSNAMVYVDAVLPSEAGCPAAGEIRPSESMGPSDACGILPHALMEPPPGDAYESSAPDRWVWCGHAAAPTPRPSSTAGQQLGDLTTPPDVFINPSPVPAHAAAAMAAAIFDSEGFDASEIGGHPVFYNRCPREKLDDGCESALALSAEPYFIVFIWDGASQDDLEAMAAAFSSQITVGGS